MDIVPAITYLAGHVMKHTSFQDILIVTYNLRHQMKRLNWGFFDQAVNEEISVQNVVRAAYTN